LALRGFILFVTRQQIIELLRAGAFFVNENIKNISGTRERTGAQLKFWKWQPSRQAKKFTAWTPCHSQPLEKAAILGFRPLISKPQALTL
jgi:hypothetical protein